MRWMMWLAMVCAGGSAWADEPSGRPWQVGDSVQLRYFLYDPANPDPLNNMKRYAAPDGQKPALLSPDGRHFLFVSIRGDLSTDQIIGELSVFSVEAVQRGLRTASASVSAVHRIEFRSSRGGDYQSPIIQPHWRDARRIEFVGTRDESLKQLYHLDVDTGELKQLTHAAQDVSPGDGVREARFYETAIAAGGEQVTVLYRTTELIPKDSVRDSPLDAYPVAVIPQQTSMEDPLLSIFHLDKSWFPVNRLYAIYRGGESKLVREEGPQILHRQGLATHEGFLSVQGQWLSPDGRYAVVAYALGEANVPALWSDYEIPPRTGVQYVLVDMQAGTMRPILDAPVGAATSAGQERRPQFGAYWSQDSESVVLFNTALPLDEDKDERRSMAYVVSYRVGAGEWEVVAPMQSDGLRIEGARWVKQGESVVLNRTRLAASEEGPTTGESSDRVEGLLVSHVAGRWQAEAGTSMVVSVDEDVPAWPQGLQVYIQEDENLPQTMVAELKGRRVALSEPDPVLQNVHRLDWQPLQITSGDKVLEARVLRPEGMGEPAPLVIQLADLVLYRNQFKPDGAVFPGFAAQALAAQGFVVLHLESVLIDWQRQRRLMTTPREGPAVVASVEDAIDALVARGWVDARRVGLIGFSRSGYHVYYSITHSQRHNIGAAVVFDSVDASYGSYVNGMAVGQEVTVYDRQYAEADDAGEVPNFWQNKQAWMDAPAFNLDRASTPTLFSAVGRQNAWVMMETLGAWRYMGLPFEYRLYPQGQHALQRPRERASDYEATVSWMRYWLQDEMPMDAGQAQRWSQMKARWEQKKAHKEAQTQVSSQGDGR